MNPGIDYGMGQTNIDKKTGIRFGVISMNALNEFAWEEFEPDYGEPTCPKCGCAIQDYSELEDDSEYEEYHECSCADYFCADCLIILGTDEALAEEPICYILDKDGYKAAIDSSNDVFLTRSPYFTYAQFCSPCAPGAGHLEHPCENGIKTYCLDKTWFENNKAPYPVYSVATGELVP